MKLTGIIALALLMFSASSQALDLTENDKKKHLAASAIISAVTYGITENLYTSYGVCIGTGLAKELYDEVDYGGFSWEDMAADAIGCGLGIGLGKGITWAGNKIMFNYNF